MTEDQLEKYFNELPEGACACGHVCNNQALTQEPVAWGMPDAEGNIVDTITAFDKTGEMKPWEEQYSIPLYTAKEQHGDRTV